MIDHDWVALVPAMLLLTPLVLELMDRARGRKAHVIRSNAPSERIGAQTISPDGYAAGSGVVSNLLRE